MANFGDILSSLSIAAGQSVRRNAGDSAFEAYAADTITIGTTPIASGTNNRVLYQASGVVSQSANLTFDGTTFNIGNDTSGVSAGLIVKTGTAYPLLIRDSGGTNLGFLTSTGDLHILSNLTVTGGVIYGLNDIRSNYFQDSSVAKGYLATNVAGENFAFYPRNATNIGIVVNADAAQTANLMEWRGLSSNTLAIDKDSNIVSNTSTGIKIGTGTTQKLGFFGATPVTQRSNIGALTDNCPGSSGTTIEDPDGGIATVDMNILQDNFSRIVTRLNAIEQVLQDLGLTA